MNNLKISSMRLKVPQDGVFGPYGDTTGFLLVKVEGIVDANLVNPSEYADFFLLQDGNSLVVFDLDVIMPYNSQISLTTPPLNLISAQIEDYPAFFGKRYLYKTYTSTGTDITNQFHSQNFGKIIVSVSYSDVNITNKVRVKFLDEFDNIIADRVLAHNTEYTLTIPTENVKFSTSWIDTTPTSGFTLRLLTIED